jgi:HEPN domain-containing protein
MARSDYTEWLKRADDDLVAMERLAAYGYTPPNVVCYHAQQYAEKIVKARILQLGADFDYVHDIVVLLSSFEKTPNILQARRYAQILNRYAIVSRYPTDAGFDADEVMAEEAYRMATAFPELLEGSSLKADQ